MSGYANRGQGFENAVEIMNAMYANQNKAVISKIPTPWLPVRGRSGNIVSAKVAKKSTVDYIGSYQGRSIAFDAKECRSAERIDLNRVEEHQQAFLRRHMQNGGISFVLVAFRGDRYFVVPWEEWQKRIVLSMTGGKKSINVKEFLPVWRVERNLDYLKTVDNLFGRDGGYLWMK